MTPDLFWRLLRAAPPSPPSVTRTGGGLDQGLEWHRLELRAGRSIPALMLDPAPVSPARAPVLYCHAHGHRPDIGKAEALSGRPALLDPPLAVALARAGHPVLCPDMPGFGERQSEGTESALAKALLWQGETLLGRMIEDLSAALDHLLASFDRAPLTVGFSMGAFLSAGIAALRPEVGAAAHMCGMAAIAPLIATGAHDLHAPYLTIPGLLHDHDLPDIAAMIAPRPQFMAAGALDPLTPPEALAPACARLRRVYAEDGPLVLHMEPEAGHVETPAMRAALLEFLAAV